MRTRISLVWSHSQTVGSNFGFAKIRKKIERSKSGQYLLFKNADSTYATKVSQLGRQL